MLTTDYEAAREMALEARSKLENSPYTDTKLLSFAEVLTPIGIKFPNKETEREFRKFVTYPDSSSNTRIAVSYFIAIAKVLERTETHREKETPGSRSALESIAG